MTDVVTKKMVKGLIVWYRKHGRAFSFREVNDPYQVLVAEIMLRKTTARQVEKVFNTFIKRFPTVGSLARANPSSVRRVIKPLGISGRAEQLIQIAKKIVEQHRGKIPDDSNELSRLPGVGEYIAGCVLTFCYEKPQPLIDSNITRVLSRLYGIRDLNGASARRRLRKLYTQLSPPKLEREFHYALLDLAAKLCGPRAPSCPQCPFRTVCRFCKPLMRKQPMQGETTSGEIRFRFLGG